MLEDIKAKHLDEIQEWELKFKDQKSKSEEKCRQFEARIQEKEDDIEALQQEITEKESKINDLEYQINLNTNQHQHSNKEIVEKYESIVVQLKKTHESELNSLKSDQIAALKSLSQTHENAISAIKSEHSSQCEVRENAFRFQISELETSHHEFKISTIKDHSNQIEKLSKAHEMTISQ